MRPLALTVIGVVLLLAVAGAALSSAPSAQAVTPSGSCPNGKPAKGITKIQAIQLELLRRSSFNELDGAQVARDLL